MNLWRILTLSLVRVPPEKLPSSFFVPQETEHWDQLDHSVTSALFRKLKIWILDGSQILANSSTITSPAASIFLGSWRYFLSELSISISRWRRVFSSKTSSLSSQSLSHESSLFSALAGSAKWRNWVCLQQKSGPTAGVSFQAYLGNSGTTPGQGVLVGPYWKRLNFDNLKCNLKYIRKIFIHILTD